MKNCMGKGSSEVLFEVLLGNSLISYLKNCMGKGSSEVLFEVLLGNSLISYLLVVIKLFTCSAIYCHSAM